MIKKYKDRFNNEKDEPIVEAIKYTGDNYNEICEFVGKNIKYVPENWTEIPNDTLYFEYDNGGIYAYANKHYVVKAEYGIFYPIRKDIFEYSFELIE